MTLASRIAEAIELAGTNKNAIAKKIDVQWQTVQKWTLGESEPTVQNLADFARATRVCTNWLLGLDGDPRPHAQLRLALR